MNPQQTPPPQLGQTTTPPPGFPQVGPIPLPPTPPAGTPPVQGNAGYPPIVQLPPYGPPNANGGGPVGSEPPAYGPSQPAALPSDPPPATTKQEIIGHLQKSNNVLVTVNNNPSVDQLASAIGLTLVLNKMGKHATAVYSGQTPSTIEFLQPEKTIEKNTDSLRDFIIALDKSKADKLRYKVEDTFVKIFITPYHTSLSEKDLEFSQGDFNVDVIVALGVRQKEELDQAITAHGRILHDAVTISVNNKQMSDLGALNWFDAAASSLSEMAVSLIEPMQGDKVLLDSQVATAFLTGIVAETERFSNPKTTANTMSIAAQLMKAGANQQLVASKLEIPQELAVQKPVATQAQNAPAPAQATDGSIAIAHNLPASPSSTKTLQELENENREKSTGEEDNGSDLAKIHIDESGKFMAADGKPPAASATPPATMNAVDSEEDRHKKVIAPLPGQSDGLNKTVVSGSTLSELEKAVDSNHVNSLDSPTSLPPVPGAATAAAADPAPATTEEAFPPQLIGPDKGLPTDPNAGATDPGAPPPVPPPMMPPQ